MNMISGKQLICNLVFLSFLVGDTWMHMYYNKAIAKIAGFNKMMNQQVAKNKEA